jgi:hypothetical protein
MNMRFKIFTVVDAQMVALWCVTLCCSLVDGNQRLGATSYRSILREYLHGNSVARV